MIYKVGITFGATLGDKAGSLKTKIFTSTNDLSTKSAADFAAFGNAIASVYSDGALKEITLNNIDKYVVGE